VREDIAEHTSRSHFIKEKIAFLERKVASAGGENEASAIFPKAVKRLKMGPLLLQREERCIEKLHAELLSMI
jgi:hypothetical protein